MRNLFFVNFEIFFPKIWSGSTEYVKLLCLFLPKIYLDMYCCFLSIRDNKLWSTFLNWLLSILLLIHGFYSAVFCFETIKVVMTDFFIVTWMLKLLWLYFFLNINAICSCKVPAFEVNKHLINDKYVITLYWFLFYRFNIWHAWCVRSTQGNKVLVYCSYNTRTSWQSFLFQSKGKM